MPNWCMNSLKVSGFLSKHEMETFKSTALKIGPGGNGQDEDFCIENFLPLPKELENTQSPSRPLMPGEYIKALKAYEIDKKIPGLIVTKPITNKISQELKEKYGADNWYDWNIANYGTKWGFTNSNLIIEGKSYLKYEFDTAWSQPTEAILKISKMYPNLMFKLWYEEPGACFKGWQLIINGKIEDEKDT